MASRVTPAEVKAIITTTLTDAIVQVWIDAANAVVNSIIPCVGSDEVMLTQIELFLSAHNVGMLDPAVRGFVTKEKLDVFETTYANPAITKDLISSTVYGQTANRISNGCLTNVDDKASSVEFF